LEFIGGTQESKIAEKSRRSSSHKNSRKRTRKSPGSYRKKPTELGSPIVLYQDFIFYKEA
jgi:hypothetical protein